MKVDIYNSEKKYKVIYADPPWSYRVWPRSDAGRTASSHYRVMSLDDIKDLPVESLADKDCALFLWVTYPNLTEAFEVIDAWGFKYKTVAFTWVKQCRKSDNIFTGMGHWTRANAEICLLAVKGHPKRVAKNVKQVIISHIEEHSKKPSEVRTRIENLMGRDLTRIELFARQAADGWDRWGLEAPED